MWGVATPYDHVVQQLLSRHELDRRCRAGRSLVPVRLREQRGTQRPLAAHGAEELEHERRVWGLALEAELRVWCLTMSHNPYGRHSDRTLKADLVDCPRPSRTAVERLCQQKLHLALPKPLVASVGTADNARAWTRGGKQPTLSW